MTAALASDRDRIDRADQLQQLRRQMAAVSERVGAGYRGRAAPEAGAVAEKSLLPIPDSLVGLLPFGLPRGAVGVLTGARSLSVSMVAAVTAAGGYAAIVGQPDTGLLAATELGVDLDRLAVIPDPGADPVEVASVLVDGMDLVVLGLRGRTVAPSRARVVTARAQQRGCTVLIADGDWPGAAFRLDARVCGYELTGGSVSGVGRIGRVRLTTRARGKVLGRVG